MTDRIMEPKLDGLTSRMAAELMKVRVTGWTSDQNERSDVGWMIKKKKNTKRKGWGQKGEQMLDYSRVHLAVFSQVCVQTDKSV